MKQDAWERRVSEELRERRIEPRPELWERLNDQLEELPSSPQKSRGNLYLRYAAVAVIALIVASLFWTRGKEEVNSLPEVVVEYAEPVLPIPEQKNIEPSTEESAVMALEEKQEGEKIPPRLAQQEILEDELLLVEVETKEHSPLDQVIEKKAQGLLTEVLAMQESGRIVTDSEVDSLLRKAQTEILAERQWAKPVGGGTDAMALLAEAEFELNNDQNFRDRLFDSLKDSFLRVSTAVAQRNK